MLQKILTLLLAAGLLCSMSANAYAEAALEPQAENQSEPVKMPTAVVSETTEESTAVSTETQPTETTAPETQPIETTAPETQPAETLAPVIPTVLKIDDQHVYEGMGMPYEEGYNPSVAEGKMHLILPLIASGDIYQNKIEVSLTLDTGPMSPFVVENFHKTVELQKITPNNSTEEVELFLVDFTVDLCKDRTNGSYPVTVNISGFDPNGSPIDCAFPVYMTVTDGKSSEPTVPTMPEPEKPTAEPVVYIAGAILKPEIPQAGEPFTLTLTLKNSLDTKSVKNMLVSVNTGNMQIDSLESSDTIPVKEIAAGGTAEITMQFQSDASIPSGKYPISFHFQYDSSKTLNLSSSGTAAVPIRQKANMELVMPKVPPQCSVGENFPISFQVMNMGKSAMHNVRCVVSGFGLVPSNTGYIGTMEPGTSANTEVELYIMALDASEGNEEGEQYGNTVGTVVLMYEDETGKTYEKEYTFDTYVGRPIVDTSQIQPQPEEKTAGQWWISVTILGGVILAAAAAVLIVKFKKKRSITDL